MPFEKSVTDSIITYIKSIGGQAEKVKGDSFASGRPDINACYLGRCFRIEVKTPDNKNVASKKQEANLKRWRYAGAITMVVYSKKAVQYFITACNSCHTPFGNSTLLTYTEENGCVSSCNVPKVVLDEY